MQASKLEAKAANEERWQDSIYNHAGVMDWMRSINHYPPRHYSVPRRDSGVVIPDHSARRIAAAQAKRERKARKRSIHQ